MRKLQGIALLLFISVLQAGAQDKDSAKLKVFIDCRTGCDMEFIKTELRVVDFVTDRLAADAHVLVTAQPVGSGGTQYQLNCYGQNKYQHYSDTLQFVTAPTATPSGKPAKAGAKPDD